jgi:exopolysaccharide biosynthesis polyprenyl glycosylphosphotransferase
VIFMLGGRAIARRVALTRTTPERCLVLGDAPTARALQEKLDASTITRAEVVGWVPLGEDRRTGPPAADEPGGPPRLGTVPGLAAVLWRERIDRVVISLDSAHADERLLDKIRLIKSVGVRVSLLPRLLEVVGSSVDFDDVEGVPLLGVRGYGLTKSSHYLKRGLDVTCSLGGLILLAPLFAVIAVAIKLDSRGPVFFRQRRIGRGGEAFALLKFRTMRDGADEEKPTLLALNEADGLFKIADDPRCTRVGRRLRTYSLDELPQLLNVLRGEMSLVGPRPLVPEEDGRVEGWLRRRLDMQPGMTGIWQVLGSARVPLHRMVKVDYLYRANWSLWLDVKILLRTIPYVLGRRGL